MVETLASLKATGALTHASEKQHFFLIPVFLTLIFGQIAFPDRTLENLLNLMKKLIPETHN